MSLLTFHGNSGGAISITPSEISGLRAHWDLSIDGSVTTDGSTQITTLEDQENSYDLTATSSNEPLYSDVNNRCEFRGDTREEYLKMTTWNFDLTEMTWVVVWEYSGTLSANKAVIGMVGGATTYIRSYLTSANGYTVQSRNPTVSLTAGVTASPNTDKLIIVYRFNEASVQQITTNKGGPEDDTTDFSTDSNNNTELIIGTLPTNTGETTLSTYGAQAYFYEGMVFDEYISDSDLGGLLVHLKAKHAIT